MQPAATATLPHPRPRQPWLLYVVLLLIGALLAPVVAQMARPLRSISHPLQLDAEEGFLLNQALLLRSGQSIYPTLTAPPYLVGNYPPVYPLLYAAAIGSNHATTISLPVGRCLVVLAAVFATLLLGLIAREATQCVWPAMLIVPLWLAAWEVQHWLPFARVDFPALALSLAGLFAFLRAQSPRGWMVSALLFVTAFYTRQTALLAPCACAVALAAHRQWRPLRWFALTGLGMGLAIFVLLQILTGGEFYRHTITYNRNVLDWAGWERLLRNEVLFFHGGLLRAAALLLLARAVIRLESRLIKSAPVDSLPEATSPAHTALRNYALLGLLSIVSYAKVGAAPNYLLEPLASGLLWLALELWRLQRASDGVRKPALRHGIRFWQGLLCLALLVHAGRLAWLNASIPGLYRTPAPKRADAAAAFQFIEFIQNSGQRLFSEEPIMALLAGQSPLYQPFIMTQLAREGRWDESGWLRQFPQDFDYLLLTEDLSTTRTAYERYTPAMAAAIRANYVFDQTILVTRRPQALWRRKTGTTNLQEKAP